MKRTRTGNESSNPEGDISQVVIRSADTLSKRSRSDTINQDRGTSRK